MIHVRIYGLCFNPQGELLVTKEKYGERYMTKFPGGGLEYGEGTIDCLIREFREEMNMEIRVKSHFYTTDFFQPSSFKPGQVLSIYYLVEPADPYAPITPNDEHILSAQYIPLENLETDMLTFPIDKVVLKKLTESV